MHFWSFQTILGKVEGGMRISAPSGHLASAKAQHVFPGETKDEFSPVRYETVGHRSDHIPTEQQGGEKVHEPKVIANQIKLKI